MQPLLLLEAKEKGYQQRSAIVSLHIPPALLREIDSFVRKGLFTSRSEFIRYAVMAAITQLRQLELAQERPLLSLGVR